MISICWMLETGAGTIPVSGMRRLVPRRKPGGEYNVGGGGFRSRTWSSCRLESTPPWRVAKEKATLMKIGVFGHDSEAVLSGILPDVGVTGRTEPNIAHVRGVGVIVLEG